SFGAAGEGRSGMFSVGSRGTMRTALLVLLIALVGVFAGPLGPAFADTSSPTSPSTTAPADTTATTTPVDTTATTTPADTTATTAAAPTTATTTPPDTTPTTAAAPVETTTTTAPPAAAPVGSSIIVKFQPGVSQADQQSSIARNAGTDTGAIAALQLHSVNVTDTDWTVAAARFKSDAVVARVDLDSSRKVAGAPSDTEYPQQWALPKIGWDSVYGSVNPAGSTAIAVLDTGVDGAHPDLAGRIAPGWSAFGSD